MLCLFRRVAIGGRTATDLVLNLPVVLIELLARWRLEPDALRPLTVLLLHLIVIFHLFLDDSLQTV